MPTPVMLRQYEQTLNALNDWYKANATAGPFALTHAPKIRQYLISAKGAFDRYRASLERAKRARVTLAELVELVVGIEKSL